MYTTRKLKRTIKLRKLEVWEKCFSLSIDISSKDNIQSKKQNFYSIWSQHRVNHSLWLSFHSHRIRKNRIQAGSKHTQNTNFAYEFIKISVKLSLFNKYFYVYMNFLETFKSFFDTCFSFYRPSTAWFPSYDGFSCLQWFIVITAEWNRTFFKWKA